MLKMLQIIAQSGPAVSAWCKQQTNKMAAFFARPRGRNCLCVFESPTCERSEPQTKGLVIIRLLQIDSEFPVEGWLGFGAFFKKKKHSWQNMCFSDTFGATVPENNVVNEFPSLFLHGTLFCFFFSVLFFLGLLARFLGNTGSICNSLIVILPDGAPNMPCANTCAPLRTAIPHWTPTTTAISFCKVHVCKSCNTIWRLHNLSLGSAQLEIGWSSQFHNW